MTDPKQEHGRASLPGGAIALGWSGVLPFLALSLGTWSPEWRATAAQAFLAYGAVILSFLGGIRWGRAMADGAASAQFAKAVVPSLWGWAALIALPTDVALGTLAVGFALAAWWDGGGDAIAAPATFRRLRRGLSATVLACHAVALAGWWVARS